MLIKRKAGWELPEAAATPEHIYLGRRALLRGAALAGAAGLVAPLLPATGYAADAPGTWPGANPTYPLDRPLTAESEATTYNNFYEYGSQKSIWQAAQALKVRPWTVTLDGLVEKPQTVDIDTLLARMPMEQRVYRHRCVEAWAMAVPWGGFPLRALVDFAKPTGSAKYLKMTTFMDPGMAGGQRQFWYPWPYVEGLTMAEATNDLAFIATGLYGKPLPKQNGAPLRLAVPWKYGFKSIKSIVRFTFTEERPVNFWQTIQNQEYGFWANVNPKVPHPRWSQAEERMLGTGEVRPTQIFNGYGKWVAELYRGLEKEPLFM